MGERAAPAIPFLIRVLERYDGMVEVDSALMKYFEPGTSFLVYQGKANTINPAQLVAAANLARIGRPAIQPLSVALQGADPTELYFAHLADALARIPDPAATAILMNHLKGTDRHARSRAAAALRWNIDPASLDGLIAALDDADEDVRGEAVRSLERRSGQTFGPDAAKWRAWRAGQSGTPPGL
jgi:hypothetical protein